jgi:N-succinyldiaminopimelate aminotransferase
VRQPGRPVGYPATAGEPALREACAGWLQRRYGVSLSTRPRRCCRCNGSREALFAFAQTVVDPTRPAPPWSAPTRSIRSTKARPCWPARRRPLPTATRRATSPPTGRRSTSHLGAHAAAVRLLAGQPHRRGDAAGRSGALFELSDRHGFVIASDECYSEIYFRDEPRWAACRPRKLGRSDFRGLMAFTSLSKRSNVPGMRSGFVAGDAR